MTFWSVNNASWLEGNTYSLPKTLWKPPLIIWMALIAHRTSNSILPIFAVLILRGEREKGNLSFNFLSRAQFEKCVKFRLACCQRVHPFGFYFSELFLVFPTFRVGWRKTSCISLPMWALFLLIFSDGVCLFNLSLFSLSYYLSLDRLTHSLILFLRFGDELLLGLLNISPVKRLSLIRECDKTAVSFSGNKGRGRCHQIELPSYRTFFPVLTLNMIIIYWFKATPELIKFSLRIGVVGAGGRTLVTYLHEWKGFWRVVQMLHSYSKS